MNKNILKSIASVAMVLALAILVLNLNEPNKSKVTIPTPNTGTTSDYAACFQALGNDPSEVVFVHTNTCPHCTAMKPIIQDLESSGYKFHWAEGSDLNAIDMVNNCFGDLMSGYVPQFICPNSGQTEVGSLSQAQLQAFAERCRA